MNEFIILKKYLRPLSLKDSSSLKLKDDIFYDKGKKIAVSTDTFVEGVHFLKKSKPKEFVKKILRASLSDLYCKGITPKSYFLSLALNKNAATHTWLNELKKTLSSEQKKFSIFLGGGDTTYSSKLVITITVLGFSKKNPVLRNGSTFNDDIYVTGTLCDSYIGLNVIKKKINLGQDNSYFKKKYYEPDLSFKITPHLNYIATSSIDISDGLMQDLQHICKNSKCGALIYLNSLPLSRRCKKNIINKKIKLQSIFSKGDDYQILFTAKSRSRYIIKKLSKKLNLRITKIGSITKNMNVLLQNNSKKLRINKANMGYTHIF
jgi:thiamine-monophosphate kinase